jgi:hypothetical protein
VLVSQFLNLTLSQLQLILANIMRKQSYDKNHIKVLKLLHFQIISDAQVISQLPNLFGCQVGIIS